MDGVILTGSGFNPYIRFPASGLKPIYRWLLVPRDKSRGYSNILLISELRLGMRDKKNSILNIVSMIERIETEFHKPAITKQSFVTRI